MRRKKFKKEHVALGVVALAAAGAGAYALTHQKPKAPPMPSSEYLLPNNQFVTDYHDDIAVPAMGLRGLESATVQP